MAIRVIYEKEGHKVIMFEELTPASAVEANQFLIWDNGEAMLLDPGGHKVYSKLISDLSKVGCNLVNIKYIFLSHQDPDIVASINGWLIVAKNAKALIPQIWLRFLPHFGLESSFEERVEGIEDKGMRVKLGQEELIILPAHFLHSPGNFQVYDPVSKTLFSGDLFASLNQPYMEVENFDEHISYMEAFHRRYIASSKVIKLYLNMVRKLDIEVVAPQHGAIFRGKELIEKLFNWLESLPCGVDLLTQEDYQIP